jgi:hypothetical protein
MYVHGPFATEIRLFNRWGYKTLCEPTQKPMLGWPRD